jgi:hypothetical protein
MSLTDTTKWFPYRQTEDSITFRQTEEEIARQEKKKLGKLAISITSRISAVSGANIHYDSIPFLIPEIARPHVVKGFLDDLNAYVAHDPKYNISIRKMPGLYGLYGLIMTKKEDYE